MNKAVPSVERVLLARLGEILRDVEWLGGVHSRAAKRSPPDRADASVHLGLRRGRGAELRLHVSKDLRPGAFQTWAERRRPVSKVTAVPVRRPARPAANLGTIAAARVLRALLSPAHAGRTWTQRSLQAQTCSPKIDGDAPVSLGLVNKVIHYMRDEGFVEEIGHRGVRVRDPGGVLAAWSKAYRFERHERRSYFSLLKGAALHEAIYRVGLGAGGMAAYAAFSAAERQAPHVRQPKTWLYVSAAFLDSLVQHTQAKEVDSGESLVVLIPDDSGVFLSFEADSHRLGCTDPVQTYVDLIHCGGRGEEAAQALLDQKILPPWKALART